MGIAIIKNGAPRCVRAQARVIVPAPGRSRLGAYSGVPATVSSTTRNWLRRS
jgi:hypothetical protein